MMRVLKNVSIVVLTLLASCVTPVEPDAIGFEDLLVVESVLTDQLTNQTVKLSRTVELNSDERRPETGATVSIISSEGDNFPFNEEEPGVYRSNLQFAADFGISYQLQIERNDGSIYQSTEEELVPVPPIDSVYAEFVENPDFEENPVQRGVGSFSFYFDVRNNETPTRSFRYLWSETYRITVPNPSRWEWLGGNDFRFRQEDIPEEQEEFCFRHDTSRQVILGRSLAENGELVRFPIHSFDAESRRLNNRYSIEVTQYGLSAEAEEFWSNVAQISQSQGSLFDVQPGTIVGNIESVSNSGEAVLGIFEVSQEVRYRAFFNGTDFIPQGFGVTSLFWVDCEQELFEVPVEEAGAFREENDGALELLFFITNGPAVFGLRRCALCTLYGSNVQPDFWVNG